MVVVWSHPCNISKVCLYECLKSPYVLVWSFQWTVLQLCQLQHFQGPDFLISGANEKFTVVT